MALYPYQQRVKELVLQGRSIILQAPTGAGKTRAALAPYLEAFFDRRPNEFPRKCIYSVPMRVLANQFYAEYDELTERYRRRTRREMQTAIQTGDQSRDPKFERDLIFATIDQSLSSALAVPYSLSAGMANLNAGAFYSSYLIFDEFHLFPLADEEGAEGALTTVLQLLMQVKGVTPFVLMTATFSSTMLQALATLLEAEVVQVPPEEYRKIAQGTADAPRRRFYQVHDSLLTAEAIMEAHQRRTLVICNQVKRAQELFEALQTENDGTVQIELLHSRFLPEHRRDKEARIRREFGKDRAQQSVESMIVVATQVIEVGLDITCEALHTEIAPANAIFQRAGRCARYPGELGIVHIYQVPLRARKDGVSYRDYLPYPKQLCEAAWQSFQQRDKQEIDFIEEQAVIDEVHTASDRKLIDAMQRQQGLLWNDIYAAMQTGAREQRRNLIRRVDNITVLAAPTPASVGDPLRAQGFGLWRGTVKGLLSTLAEFRMGWSPAGDDTDWLMQFPTISSPDPDDPTEPIVVTWREVTDESLLDGTAIVVINSAFCDYNKELGFRVVPPEAGGWSSQPGETLTRNSQGGYSYQLESYKDHIQNMLTVYRREFVTGYAYLEKRLERGWQIPPGGLTNAIETAIALHDLAKLDQRWQRWVRLYQAGIGEPLADGAYMAVHTHWEPYNPIHQQAKRQADRQCKRPPHAGESAVAGAQIIGERCGHDELTRAVLTAITRHHSAQAYQFQEYTLHPAAAQAAADALALTTVGKAQAGLLMTAPPIKLEEYLVELGNFRGLLLYLWIVRVLRLCDGLSQEE